MSINNLNDLKIDNRLQLGYGSAWHLLRCLGWQRERFTDHVSRSIGVSTINWLDFPLGGKLNYPSGMPIRDGEWKRIKFAAAELKEQYKAFWPSRGEQQNWDAVGYSNSVSGEELVLVEAKAHPAEIKFNGTDASEDGGRPIIRNAFQETLRACNFDESSAMIQAEKWLTGCYQYANRLATLHFFHKQNISARLVFLYFCGDQHPSGIYCPQVVAEWDETLKLVKSYLGLKGTSDLESRIHTVFIDVNEIFSGNVQ